MSILHTISRVAFTVNAFLCYFRFSTISWHSKRLSIDKALKNMQDFFRVYLEVNIFTAIALNTVYETH